MLARFSAVKRSDRLRAIGWLVLTCGLIGAAGFYWVETRAAGPALDDTTALGYARSLHHQMGVMMGQFGILLTEWQDALTSPAGEALLIALGAGLVAGCFFRMAWVIDQEEQRGDVDVAALVGRLLPPLTIPANGVHLQSTDQTETRGEEAGDDFGRRAD